MKTCMPYTFYLHAYTPHAHLLTHHHHHHHPPAQRVDIAPYPYPHTNKHTPTPPHTHTHTRSYTNVPRVTVKVHTAEFPAASVAAHATVVSPSANVDPDSMLHKMSGDGSTLSVAVGLGQDAREDVVKTSFGQVIVGGTVSIT